MFSKVWKAVKEVAIAVLLVISLWLVIGGALKKDIGNLSDWISAACNVVMALAALFAANEARKWFQQKASLNNLDAAHKLALEFENSVWEINSRLYVDTVLRRKIQNWIETEEKSRDEIKSIVLHEIDKNIGSDLDQLAFIYNYQSRLARFNVFPSKEFSELLNKIKIERDQYLTAHYSYLSELVYYYRNKDRTEPPIMDHVESAQKALASTFQLQLAKRDISSDYFFI